MARKIIVLEQVGLPSDAAYRAAYWLDVPSTRWAFYANPSATSAVKDATQAEIDAIKAGSIQEQLGIVVRPAGTNLAALGAVLVTEYNTRQSRLTNENPYNRYGTFWDGTAWNPEGVA